MSFADAIKAISERAQSNGSDVPENAPCGRPWRSDDVITDDRVYCDGSWHHAWDGVTGRCPLVRAKEVQAKVTDERRRLAAEFAKIASVSTFGWDGYKANRDGLKGGDHALEVMRRFASKLDCNVLLVGPTGLGKSHLLLSSHFELLGRGIPSVYIRTPELRRWFRNASSYEPEIQEEARRNLEPILYASAVHFDDAGHVENDERSRGPFAEGLKDLLDRSRGRWAVATNRTSEAARRHPDLGDVMVSRMMLDAEIVVMDGVDFRAKSARKGKRK